jgi:hypothetical protein
MNEVESNGGVSGTSRKIKWAVAAFFAAAVAVAVMNLPRGYSDDLSRIGQGRTAVVLVRDKNAVESMDLMNVLNRVRNQYAGRVVFLLTDYDTQQGRAFIAANKAARTTLVLFDPSGRPVKVLTAPQTAANVEKAIAAINGASA